ncbi:hypothetical protein GCM10022251_78700 [Phytohabitans flavus]|uniref:Uncharacterized protein n=1 Tax=Phytohabitans flavus TaxID=1076124 RepID=A0A6F8XLS5_9ACTN|nr:hypothetical protein Pflav_011490 [Phytohabitans flavus]
MSERVGNYVSVRPLQVGNYVSADIAYLGVVGLSRVKGIPVVLTRPDSWSDSHRVG